VVGLGATRVHELVPNAARKGKVSQAIAVQVAYLPLPQKELDAAEPMGAEITPSQPSTSAVMVFRIDILPFLTLDIL
jgi:hypothetical protein